MPILDPEIHDEKIIFWNKVYRATLLLLVIIMVLLVGWNAYTTNQNQVSLRQIVVANNRATVEARKINTIRQDSLKGYIKCLSLAHFDDPSLISPTVTKQQVSGALDKCAKETN